MSDKTFDRRVIVVQLAMVGLALVGAWYMINMALNRLPPPAATTYEIPVITTNDKPLCPGEKVVYDQIAHFANTPVALEIVTTVWSVDRNRTIVFDANPLHVNYRQPTTVNLHAELVVKEEWSPGQYEWLRSTTASGRQGEMFAVTFTVAEGCK